MPSSKTCDFNKMDQLSAEKKLSLSYALCIAAGATASITSGVAWGHWKSTLDQCIGRNCSCILYGEYTPSKFLGGDNGVCIWVTFGPLFYTFFAACFTCFHGYRVLFTKKSPSTRTRTNVIAKMEHGESVQIETISQEDTGPLPTCFWVLASILSVFFAVYSLVHWAIFLDGYYKTCNQFRRQLEVMLRLDGTALPVIHNRLSCESIFSFMDYLQMDSVNSYRNGFINTGVDLIIGLVGAGVSWILFSYLSYWNIKLAKRSQNT